MKQPSNVTQLHNAMGPQKPKNKKKISNRGRRRKRATMIVAVFAVVIAFLGFQLYSAKAQLHQNNVAIQKNKTELKQKQQKQADLKQQQKNLHNKDYVNELAHSKYNYSKKGETNYNFADKKLNHE